MYNDQVISSKYKLKNGEVITIVINDEFEVSYYDKNGKCLPNSGFVFVYDEISTNYLLARMYVPSNLKRQGLGRATIKFFKETYDVLIFARSHDGISREDGSHLTEDAPSFVSKMISEGLLIDNEVKYIDDDD